MDMWHIFICEVYSGIESVGPKIWTPIKYPSKLVGLCLSLNSIGIIMGIEGSNHGYANKGERLTNQLFPMLLCKLFKVQNFHIIFLIYII